MATKILMIHGRGQASDERTASSPDLLKAYVLEKKLPFLAGLAKGLVFARRPPIDESDVIFPFYGNAFNEIIRQFEATGGRVPELESVATADLGNESVAGDDAVDLSRLQAELLRDMAERLQYDAQNELSHSGEESVFEEGVSANDFLKIPYMTGALQFLSRKTSVSGLIIRRHLADVAYYVGRDEMREAVLDVVRSAVQENSSPGDDVVVLGHSLGSVVAYDLLAANDETIQQRNVTLFVTAGCPLGLDVVKKRVVGRQDGQPARVPAAVPARPGGWINAYDVLDVVALIHPLAPEFQQRTERQIVDERTNNPSGPHNIVDYLADPDVAAPISRAMTGG